MQAVMEKIKAAREAGHVRRCHVLPHKGDYKISEHCYGATSLLLLLHPSPSLALIKEIMWHDLSERWVGDMPAPAKWYNEVLGREYEKTEDLVKEKLGFSFEISDEDRVWLNACDKLDLLFWCYDELHFGNQHLQHTITHLKTYFEERWEEWPQIVREIVLNYKWSRLHEYGQGEMKTGEIQNVS